MQKHSLLILFLIFNGCRHTNQTAGTKSSNAVAESKQSYFACKQLGVNAYRPYYMKFDQKTGSYTDYSKIAKGLLGQHAMRSQKECNLALTAANHEHGVICSRTGLDGYKPTLYTGTRPGRADFGYLGGSSIMNYEDCLTATKYSSKKGVCFWGGSSWYRSPIDRAGVSGGSYRSLTACIEDTKESAAVGSGSAEPEDHNPGSNSGN